MNITDISVLFVEDDIDTRSVFIPLLKKRVKHVYEASDGIEGFALFNKLKPDLIITDIKMPNENGMTFINKVKKNISTTSYICLHSLLQ
jgi:YesN/AraC family two-component response regulator